MAERVTEPQERPETEQRGLTQPIGVGSPHGESLSPAVDGFGGRARAREAIFSLEKVMVAYSGKAAVRDVSFDIGKNEITALIGPSGCGKSTLIRCLNRMNDLIPGATVEGMCATTARTSTAAGGCRRGAQAGSAWSSSPTRSPSRSTTTSPSARACWG